MKEVGVFSSPNFLRNIPSKVFQSVMELTTKEKYGDKSLPLKVYENNLQTTC